jgi:hypothetical protein
VKRRKGNREIIPTINDHNGMIITDSIEKANILNSYYASVLCCGRNIPKIQLANSGENFIINTKIIRKRITKNEKKKSVCPDGIPGEILKLGWEDTTPYLAILLEISLHNATIPSDWKKPQWFLFTKGVIGSAVTNYRPISLTSVVCEQLEHVVAGYLRQVWDKNDWLYEGQHGFRPEYSCESLHIVPGHSGLFGQGGRYRSDYNRYFQGFRLIPHNRLLTKQAASGVDSTVVVWIREFLVARTQRVRLRAKLSKEVKVTSGMPQ